MKTTDVKPATYCVACRHNLQNRCDILGEITHEHQLFCNRAGYREIKQTYSSVRRYHNRMGDPYESELR